MSRKISVKKPEVLSIYFDQASDEYQSGEVLSGHLLVDLKHRMNVGSIKFSVEGRIETSWKATVADLTAQQRLKNDAPTTSTVQFSDVAEVWRQEIVLWSDSIRDSECLLPGHHKFPFQFAIPSYLPSSFEATFGHIQYCCKATIQKPWKVDHTVIKQFHLTGQYNLNEIPNLSQPIERKEESDLRKVKCSAKIDRKGFAPNETIQVQLTIQNLSPAVVGPTQLSLIQMAQFRGEDGSGNKCSKDLSTTIVTVDKGSISPNAHVVSDNVKIKIPRSVTTATHPANSELPITIQYYVEVIIADCLSLKLPITVGSEPLIVTPAVSSPLHNLPPPPSYEECISENHAALS